MQGEHTYIHLGHFGNRIFFFFVNDDVILYSESLKIFSFFKFKKLYDLENVPIMKVYFDLQSLPMKWPRQSLSGLQTSENLGLNV